MIDRLSSVAHYVIARLPPAQLGATKLNKVLWFADCEFYRRHGKSITGEREYVRKPQGPCLVRFEETVKSLSAEGLIHEESVPTMVGNRRQMYSTADPDIGGFTAEEIDVLNQVAWEIAQLTAQQASDESHDVLWEETGANCMMSVAAGAVKSRGLDPAHLAWAQAAVA